MDIRSTFGGSNYLKAADLQGRAVTVVMDRVEQEIMKAGNGGGR